MRFNFRVILIWIILSVSNLFPQNTFFIKYKEIVSKQEIYEKITQQKLISSASNLPLNKKIKSVTHLAKGLGSGDEILSKIIKISFDKSVSEKNIYGLKDIDPTIEYIQKSTRNQQTTE